MKLASIYLIAAMGLALLGTSCQNAIGFPVDTLGSVPLAITSLEAPETAKQGETISLIVEFVGGECDAGPIIRGIKEEAESVRITLSVLVHGSKDKPRPDAAACKSPGRKALTYKSQSLKPLIVQVANPAVDKYLEVDERFTKQVTIVP